MGPSETMTMAIAHNAIRVGTSSLSPPAIQNGASASDQIRMRMKLT